MVQKKPLDPKNLVIAEEPPESSLPLGRKTPLTDAAQVDLALHRVLLDRPRIHNRDAVAFEGRRELESDRVAFDASLHRLFAEELRRVGAGQLLSLIHI